LCFDHPEGLKDPWDVEIYFDPTVNYLVKKTVYTIHGKSDYVREDEITDFTECSPGLFFPRNAAGRSGAPENWTLTTKSVLSEIRVNQALPADTFRIRFPHNVIMTDAIRGTRYRIDSNGNRISEETPYANVKSIPPPGVDPSDDPPHVETREEPRSWTRWILPISVAILVAGLIAAHIRRRRRAQGITQSL